MKLKVKDMDIATGSTLVAILNEEDAHKLDLHHEDRIKLKFKTRETTAVIDIAQGKKSVPPGQIGLFEEVLKKLNIKQGNIIEIDLAEKPASVYYIKDKIEGKHLKKEEIDSIVKDIVSGKLSAIELTYFIGACYTKGMNTEETIALTKSIVKNGTQLKLDKRPILDKHCSGGVPGNRTTMLVVPIVAAAGFTIPKTSSRSITSPAGTADTMEVFAPVALSVEQMKHVVKKTNGCIIWGGGVNLAAADDKLIRLRHPLSLDPEGMLLSSILAKKAAVNATHVLIDIPIGRDTKIKTRSHALKLKKSFKKIGKKLGMKIRVVITLGSEPIGNGIGPALEAKDILYILTRDEKRPIDLERKCILIASQLLQMVGVRNARKKVIKILESGKAYEKMKEIIKAQGGNPNIKPDQIHVGEHSYTFKSPKSGIISDIDNFTINKIARIAGAPKDKGSGIYIYRHQGDFVKKGDKIMTIYAENKIKLNYALNILRKIGGIVIDHTLVTQ
ncbi:AMP phosphorylase [Candidatus Woesearchaeota archaeon]|nr:AMP phosphorylase [Candidatus Woesearchaeota archaeon]